MRAINTGSSSKAVAVAVAAINPAKIQLMLGLVLAALVATVYAANANAAANNMQLAQYNGQLLALAQLADPSIEEAESALHPERSFKKLKCKTDEQCEQAAAKRILTLDSQITRLQLRINKHGASIVRWNDKMQQLIAERKHLQDSSKQ